MRAGQICSSAHHEKLHAAKLVAVPGGEGEEEGKGGGRRDGAGLRPPCTVNNYFVGKLNMHLMACNHSLRHLLVNIQKVQCCFLLIFNIRRQIKFFLKSVRMDKNAA